MDKSSGDAQASASASRYTAAAASRMGERGVASANHSPLHISSSSGRVVHPRRTPLSATLSDAMHPGFNHRDKIYFGGGTYIFTIKDK